MALVQRDVLAFGPGSDRRRRSRFHRRAGPVPGAARPSLPGRARHDRGGGIRRRRPLARCAHDRRRPGPAAHCSRRHRGHRRRRLASETGPNVYGSSGPPAATRRDRLPVALCRRTPSRRRARAAATALGDDAAAFDAEGRNLTWLDAATYASRARGERKRPHHGWASLTPTEHRVVAPVAEGRTNPEIAERLLMRRATVKTHLEHIFTNLAIHSRAELAAQAATRPTPA